MRTTRKLASLAFAMLVALTMASPSQATETVQVVNEDAGAGCGTIAGGGGCRVHWVGTFELRLDLGFFGEFHAATCNLEMESRIDGSGNIAVDALEHDTGPDTDCATVMTECKLPWSGAGEEDGATAVVQSRLGICVDPAAASDNCEGTLNFNIVEQAGEHYDVALSWGTVSLCEFDLDLEVEHAQAGNVEVHVNHP